ncbi:MAG: REP-associated tyrosine transposase [Bacillota bacterium]
MARYPRRMSHTQVYHVMLRGNEKKDIFLDDQDRNQFIDTLGKMKEDKNYYIYAYCLMDNHVHLLIKEANDNIARIMKRITVSYVYYFNKKYARVGHLFHDRFRSEIIDNDSYLLAAARYIHNNPVKAGLVKSAGNYKWSSYKAYVCGERARGNLISTEFLLSMFSEDPKIAVREFIRFTQQVNEDKFLDFQPSAEEECLSINDKELKERIENILGKHGRSVEELKKCVSREERDALIREIKGSISTSVRQLSKLLGISKDIVFRA